MKNFVLLAGVSIAALAGCGPGKDGRPAAAPSTVAAASSEMPIPRSVAGDKGKYFLLESNKTGNVVRALSKRVGVDTTSFSLTETNCDTMMMREIGVSDSAPSAIQERPTDWFELVPGSSKADLANFVCS